MRYLGKKRTSMLAGLAMLISMVPMLGAPAALAVGPTVFINEIHYDNVSDDIGEFVEIAGPAGTDLTDWSVALYNGANSLLYDTIALAGTIPDQDDGFGTLSFVRAGIQNGAPDGLALVDSSAGVIEFLSYEGSFTAGDGPASGMTSVDIGVSEGSSTAVGDSLQLTGTGLMGGDFTWAAPMAETPGAVNTGQTFAEPPPPPAAVINEFVANHTGADTEAFIEVFSTASTDLSAFTVLEIEGDGTGAGVVDAALSVGTTDAAGFWVDDEDMENGTLTILLVEGFTGSVGDDLDTDNDGVLDSTPWIDIVDSVALDDGSTGDITYSPVVLGVAYDGMSFVPGGASRIPNGTDTDTTADWVRNDFDGFGFPGFSGTPTPGEAENTPSAMNVAITVETDPDGVCNDPATLIHDIQGNGASTTDSGSIREIEGIVVGDFEGSTGLGGFFVQEENAQFDGDPMSSEGIFVFNGGSDSVDDGDTVRVRGTVTEFFGLTEITSVVSVETCAATGTTSPVSWSLPVADADDWEWVEGMEIFIDQTLYASGNFTQARFGEVDLSVGAPLDNPTNVVAPGAPAIALQDLNDRSRIQLDDGSNVQNPLPLPPYLGVDGTLRTGDTLAGLTGVLSFGFGLYEIHPTTEVDFTRANHRPDGPPDVGGDVTVAAYNVLNYFTTLDEDGPFCGPLQNQDCRGAFNAFELGRQRAKLVSAISELDADVVGLMEIENHPGDVPTADLVSGLNDATAAGTYDYIATGAIGTDAIRVAVIYQPDAVTPVGDFEVLDSSDDPRFDDTLNRPMLVQSFMENATGEVFTVAVNHLKSKGSDCNDVGDPDTGDGQGNCNLTRESAAMAIADYLAGDPTGVGDSDYLVIGDLNSYAMEDPITALTDAGLTDLIAAFEGTGFGDGAYSFNFFSQSGYLDHGLASETLTPRVTGASFWHVNADEPSGLDYNDFNQPGLFSPDEFRSSDHDPVIIGLNLADPMGDKEDVVAALEDLLPTGDKNTDKRLGKAIDDIESSLNPAWWTSDQTITDKRVFSHERSAIVQLALVAGSGGSTGDAAQAAIDVLVNADRQLAQIELIAAIAGGGDGGKIAEAEAAMADAAAHVEAGRYADAVNAYKDAWDAADKA